MQPFSMHRTENTIHSGVGNGLSIAANIITRMPLNTPHIPTNSVIIFFDIIPYLRKRAFRPLKRTYQPYSCFST